MEEMKCKSHNRFGPLFNKRSVRACLHLGAAIKRDVEHKEVQHEHVYGDGQTLNEDRDGVIDSARTKASL